MTSDVWPSGQEPKPASASSARAYDRLFVRHWDTWEDGKRTHLFVAPIDGTPTRDLTPGDRDTPPFSLGGPDDFGVNSWEYQGRWIPTQSVDQYIATLARWMGLSDAQVLSLLPNLGNFTVRNLGFV